MKSVISAAGNLKRQNPDMNEVFFLFYIPHMYVKSCKILSCDDYCVLMYH